MKKKSIKKWVREIMQGKELRDLIAKKEVAELSLEIWLIEQYPQYCDKDDKLDTALEKIKDHVSEADIIKRMIETKGIYEQHSKEAEAFVEGARWYMNYSGAKLSPLTFEEVAKEAAEKKYS